MGIDLHTHTTASDGSFTPRELVQLAKNQGLSAIGITDHDTLGGHAQAIAAGLELGVEIVPGIELSVKDEAGEKFHLLGYYVAADSELARELAQLQRERDARNAVIVEKLAALGAPISMARVLEIARGGVMGRPHLAQALMEAGHVASVQEAFDRYLADGAAATASKEVLTPARAVELIHAAGGVAIWAHPTRPPSKRAGEVDFAVLESQLRNWIEIGLDGLEIYYSQYSPAEARWTSEMAAKHRLLGTGGSDFHGKSKPDIQVGVVHTKGAVPDEVLVALKAKRGAETSP
jgi:predicted metal-dependent phosphoesterase TrpH